MAQENYNGYYQDNSAYHIREETSRWEEMEHSERAAGQYLSEERSAGRQPTELNHDDTDRRTLDESKDDEDEDDEE